MQNPSPPTFAARLRTLRAARNLTQEDLAEKVGIPKSTLSRWESDEETDPGVSGIRKLTTFFGCTADYLVGRASFEYALPPDHWLIDLDVYEEMVAGRARDLDRDEHLGTPVPARHRVVPSTEYHRMRADARAGASNKKRRGPP